MFTRPLDLRNWSDTPLTRHISGSQGVTGSNPPGQVLQADRRQPDRCHVSRHCLQLPPVFGRVLNRSRVCGDSTSREGRSHVRLFVRRYPPELRERAVRVVAGIGDIGWARGRPGRVMRPTWRRFGRLPLRSAACQGARHHRWLRSPLRGGVAPTGRRARPCRVRR